jgi:membrane protein YqaA with SNARE-associated domain
MIELKEIDSKVEQVLAGPVVGRAQKILQSRLGLWVIATISFLESALPIPLVTDPFLIAGVLLNRRKTVLIVFITTTASVIGGLFAYISALLFLEVLMQFMTTGMVSEFNSLVSGAHTNTFLITILGAVTPIPYTLVAWLIATLQGSLLVFFLASIVGRSLRYAIVGYSVYRFGPAASQYARRYIGLISIVIFILGGLYIWYKM